MESEHGSVSNKQFQPPLGVSFIEGDLICLEKTSSSVSESGHDDESNKPIQTPAEVVIEDDFLGFEKSSSLVMESGHDSASINFSETPEEDNNHLGLEKKSTSSSPSSPSSSSDSSFDENFFLLDENEPRSSSVEPNNLLQLDEDPHLTAKDDITADDLLSSSPASPPLPDVPISPPSQNVSHKQSPQIQLMERFEPPDPNRIPASVFARTKSTAPVEWSTQSNESLFSIHMGNNSFSRDQIFLMGRSQELGKSDDMFKFPNNTSTDINNFASPAGAVGNSNMKSSGIGVADVAAETMKEVIRESAQDRNKAKTSAEALRRTTSISHRSDGSNASTMSFAFPILTKDGTKNDSEKVESEKETQEQKQQSSQSKTPQAGTNATAASWFSCFTCSCCC